MGRIILILLAAFVVFLLISAVISALHFLFSTLFWIAIVALVIVGALRLSGSMRRRSRR
jgi:membrane protein required for beta-lactamase induction